MSRVMLNNLRKEYPALTPPERALLYAEYKTAPNKRLEERLLADFAVYLLRTLRQVKHKLPRVMSDDDLDDVLGIVFAKHGPLTLAKYDPEQGTPFSAYIAVFVQRPLLYEAYKFVRHEYAHGNDMLPIAWFDGTPAEGEEGAESGVDHDAAHEALTDMNDPEAIAIAGDLESLLEGLADGSIPPEYYAARMRNDYGRNIDPWRDRKVLLGTETKRKPRNGRKSI